tara:strand:+ start:5649 stop:5822 length:174 start_codon:yes stop_codon:yes gene_type:complete
MTELSLMAKLFLSLIIQTLFIPFRITAFVFSTIEGIARVIKETINHFIKQVQNEVKA